MAQLFPKGAPIADREIDTQEETRRDREIEREREREREISDTGRPEESSGTRGVARWNQAVPVEHWAEVGIVRC